MKIAYETNETPSRETIHILWETQKEKRGKERAERLFKAIMAKNFPNLQREMYIQIYEAPKFLNRLNLKKSIQKPHCN